MEAKKYELIPSDKEGLFRIVALQDFSDVKAGDIGGYVSGECNLSQDGDCWIYSDAIVRDNAKVYDDACVYGNAEVYEEAIVRDNAMVYENAKVYGDAMVGGNAGVYGNAKVYGDVVVYGDAMVYGNAKMCGIVEVGGNADICGDALIEKIGDYMVFQNSWSSGRYFTWTRSNDMWKVGCFYGTGKELIMKAYADSELSGTMYELYVNLVNEMLKKEKEL